jgi:hypothetical protein
MAQVSLENITNGGGFLQPILKLAPSLLGSKGLTVQYMKTSKIIMTLQTQGYAKDIWV